MAKSIKLKNNNYIDSTGVVHNRGLLSTLLGSILEDITYLKNRCVYSTNEVAIGKWIDGKTIYRKVVSKTNNTSRDFHIAVPSNIDTMVNYTVMAFSNEEVMTIPNNSISYASGNTPRSAVYLTNNNSWSKNNLYIIEVANFTTFYAIIEYTKK